MASKRETDSEDTAPDPKRPRKEPCIFRDKCYRRNPMHFKEYSHDHLEKLSSLPEDAPQVVQDQWKILQDLGLLTNETHKKKIPSPKSERKVLPSAEKNTVQEQPKKHPLLTKFDKAKPFNMFLTKVKKLPSTHSDDSSIFLTDLLHICHGNLKSSVQINFLVDFEWLKMCYEATGNEKLPMLILHGEDRPELSSKNLPENVTAIRVRSPYPFGTHHTKLMILIYDDNAVRIVVSTANLVPSDWENRTQGLWVSPICRPADDPKDSATGFKSSLLRYLRSYNLSQMKAYIDLIAAADFSSINAFFVASSPGNFEGSSMCHFGHMAAGSILRRHSKPVKWPLIVQCSSIGSLGQTPSTWVTSELSDSLGCDKSDVKIVYPSKKNVFRSLDGILGGECLPYRRNVHEKQPWIRDYMYQWTCDQWSRSKAVPHIKTYTRVEDSKASFVMLTSANLSKAAWGKLNKNRDKFNIMSYEAGVLLLPSFVLGPQAEYFELDADPSKLILPYDLPLTKYENDDTPFFFDLLLDH